MVFVEWIAGFLSIDLFQKKCICFVALRFVRSAFRLSKPLGAASSSEDSCPQCKGLPVASDQTTESDPSKVVLCFRGLRKKVPLSWCFGQKKAKMLD